VGARAIVAYMLAAAECDTLCVAEGNCLDTHEQLR